jgi:hypothetical protein
MLKQIACSLALLSTSLAFAGTIEPKKVEQSVNDVVAMKSYDHGDIRIFVADEQEPAAAPFKVVVSLPMGGDQFIEHESFEVGSYCSVNLAGATTRIITTTAWPTRIISIPVKTSHAVTGKCVNASTLTVSAMLMDDSESNLKASIRK